MKNRGFFVVAILGLFLALFSGCQEVSNDQSGRIVVKITDAPFPIDLIEEANVTITKVEIRNEDESEEGEEGEESSFITIFEGSEEFNLIELRNGVMAELIDMEIPAGNYNLIRIYVENASIAVKDYETYSVKVPSGSQTGIKMFVKPSLKVTGGLTAEVLLDFNLDKSFVLKGNMETPAGIKGFNFKPVIRAVNNTTAGVVQGLVTDTVDIPLVDVAVSIAQDSVVTTAYTDSTGFYAMPGLPAGMYTMSAEKEGYNPVTIEEVEVVEGNKTVQDIEMEPVTPEE